MYTLPPISPLPWRERIKVREGKIDFKYQKRITEFVKRSLIPYHRSIVDNANQAKETITFLGTGGARFMIISQLLASGGLWFNFEGTQILMDPGPGCIVQVNKRKLNPQELSAIIVSHRHLDHSADVNVMTEAMTDGGFRKHGIIFTPRDAIESDSILHSYLRKSIEGIEYLEAGKTFSVGNVSFTTPVRHVHMVENYGLIFKTKKHTIAYITDTRYFEELGSYYRGEVNRYNGTTGAFIDHFVPNSGEPGIPNFLIFMPAGQATTCAMADTTNGCLRTRTITYTAVDSCSNSNTCTQFIT